MNIKKWIENAPLVIVAVIIGSLIGFTLTSLNDYHTLRDRAEERGKAPQAQINVFNPQYPDRVVVTLALANPTSGSTAFSDFMLNLQRCGNSIAYTYPTYDLSAEDGTSTEPAKPINVPSREKAMLTLAFLVVPEGGAATNADSVCRVSVAWFDENNQRRETKPMVFDRPVSFYRASGSIP